MFVFDLDDLYTVKIFSFKVDMKCDVDDRNFKNSEISKEPISFSKVVEFFAVCFPFFRAVLTFGEVYVSSKGSVEGVVAIFTC